MYYVHRDKDGNITRMTNQPCGSIERLTNDHPDIIAFLNPPARPDPQAEFEAAIAAATTIAELKEALLGLNIASKAIAGRK